MFPVFSLACGRIRTSAQQQAPEQPHGAQQHAPEQPHVAQQHAPEQPHVAQQQEPEPNRWMDKVIAMWPGIQRAVLERDAEASARIIDTLNAEMVASNLETEGDRQRAQQNGYTHLAHVFDFPTTTRKTGASPSHVSKSHMLANPLTIVLSGQEYEVLWITVYLHPGFCIVFDVTFFIPYNEEHAYVPHERMLSCTVRQNASRNENTIGMKNFPEQVLFKEKR